MESDGSLTSLASPYWDWGSFYIRLVSSILRGGWEALNYKGSGKAVNYWWGMSAGVVGLELADELPDGPRSLANILCRSIIEGEITVFHRRYPLAGRHPSSATGAAGSARRTCCTWTGWWTPSTGASPAFDELLPMSRRLVRLLGVYRDSLPPEKGGAAL